MVHGWLLKRGSRPLERQDSRVDAVALGLGPAEESRQSSVTVEDSPGRQRTAIPPATSRQDRSIPANDGHVQVLEPPHLRQLTSKPVQEGLDHVVVVLQGSTARPAPLAAPAGNGRKPTQYPSEAEPPTPSLEYPHLALHFGCLPRA